METGDSTWKNNTSSDLIGILILQGPSGEWVRRK